MKEREEREHFREQGKEEERIEMEEKKSNVGISPFFHFTLLPWPLVWQCSPGVGSELTVDNSVQCLSSATSLSLPICMSV